MFGINDARTIFYHSFGGILAQIDAPKAIIPVIRAGGAEPILSTIFPPDPRASATALDPDWFADPRPLPKGGSTQDMNFPAFLAAPAHPENHHRRVRRR